MAEGEAMDFNVLRHGHRHEEHRHSNRRARSRKDDKHFDKIEGLDPLSKQCNIDLCMFFFIFLNIFVIKNIKFLFS